MIGVGEFLLFIAGVVRKQSGTSPSTCVYFPRPPPPVHGVGAVCMVLGSAVKG